MFPDFLEESADVVAQRLLGCTFTRTITYAGEKHTLVARIVETEAYDESDPAMRSAAKPNATLPCTGQPAISTSTFHTGCISAAMSFVTRTATVPVCSSEPLNRFRELKRCAPSVKAVKLANILYATTISPMVPVKFVPPSALIVHSTDIICARLPLCFLSTLFMTTNASLQRHVLVSAKMPML